MLKIDFSKLQSIFENCVKIMIALNCKQNIDYQDFCGIKLEKHNLDFYLHKLNKKSGITKVSRFGVGIVYRVG